MSGTAQRTRTGCPHGVAGHSTAREYLRCHVAHAPEPTAEQTLTINRLIWS